MEDVRSKMANQCSHKQHYQMLDGMSVELAEMPKIW